MTISTATERRTRTLNRRFLASLCLVTFVVGASSQAKDGPQGLRFNSPGVLDLAERTQKMQSASALSATALAAADAKKILAAPALTEEQSTLTFSDEIYGCKTPTRVCAQEHERKLLTAADGSVKRIDRQLIVAVGSGQPLIFVDWKMPETKTADGDEETHWYLGRLSGNGYHRVEVQFGHDAPGSFLINPQSEKIAFVHNGADVVAPSLNGQHLVTFNTLNPPLSIRVAALDAAGPRLELQCEIDANASPARAQFKGWHDADSFDLVLLPEGANGQEALPLRIAQIAHGWSLAAVAVERIAAVGFFCH